MPLPTSTVLGSNLEEQAYSFVDNGDGTMTPVVSLAGGAESGGFASSANSSTTPLASGAAFPGEWELNDAEQVMLNVFSDVDGVVTVEFGIPDGSGGYIVSASLPRAIEGGKPYFRALVKGAGRAVRVSYANGTAAQSTFALLTAYGSNLLPVSASADSEILTTSTPALRDRFVAFGKSDVVTSGYALWVDLDGAEWPHDRRGRLDLTQVFLTVDRDASAQGVLQLGVVTRIDVTDADVAFVQGIGFDKTTTRSLIRDRNLSPSTLKCGVVNGALEDVVSSFVATGIAELNTATPIETPIAGVTKAPGVGDLVVYWRRDAGEFDLSVSGFYHGEVSP